MALKLFSTLLEKHVSIFQPFPLLQSVIKALVDLTTILMVYVALVFGKLGQLDYFSFELHKRHFLRIRALLTIAWVNPFTHYFIFHSIQWASINSLVLGQILELTGFS